MRQYLVALAMIITLAVGCSKKEEETIVGSIDIYNKGLFVAAGGQSTSTSFTHSNIASVKVDDNTGDWSINVSLETNTITVQAPSTAKMGDTESIFITGTTIDDRRVYKTFEVGVREFVALDSVQSNSIVINEGGKVYTFNPRRRGEVVAEELPQPAKCELAWVSKRGPVQHVHMTSDGRMSLYVPVDGDDLDGDNSVVDVIDGNALVYAQASDGSALWSWHIWVSEEPVSEVAIGTTNYMDRNLGAAMNSNATQSDIASSYGLYYQWGRKDPFIYPASYNAAGGVDADRTNQFGRTFEQQYVESSSDVGTIGYATAYPWNYITAAAQPNHDWVWSGADADLWGGASGAKSLNDPCPMGWQMPTAAMMGELTLDAGQSVDRYSYGLQLSGGNLFMALGFRTYITGRIQNINQNYEPWVGYYWSRDAADLQSSFMELRLIEADSVAISMARSYRANGMQVRCVRQ